MIAVGPPKKRPQRARPPEGPRASVRPIPSMMSATNACASQAKEHPWELGLILSVEKAVDLIFWRAMPMNEHPRPQFPHQSQSVPGHTPAINPVPDHGEKSYRG